MRLCIFYIILTCFFFFFFFFSAEDEAAAVRVTAKNALESYACNLRSTLNDDKLAEKFDLADKTKLEGAVNGTIKWLDSQEGSKEEYEENQKNFEVIAKYVSLFLVDLDLLLTLLF